MFGPRSKRDPGRWRITRNGHTDTYNGQLYIDKGVLAILSYGDDGDSERMTAMIGWPLTALDAFESVTDE